MTATQDYTPSFERMRPAPTFGRYVPYFLERVTPPDADGCMLWTGSLNQKGYGVVAIGPPGYTRLAHRFAYTLWVGVIPEGLVLDHLCKVRNCVAPDHLEPVTQNINAHRRTPSTHCPQGHEYVEGNIYYSKPTGVRLQPQRHCRTCVLDRQKARYRTHGRPGRK